MIRKHFGIQEYVIRLTLVPLLVMAIGFGTFLLLDRSADLDSNLLTRGQLITRQLAASSEYGVFSNNAAFLNAEAASVLQQPDVAAVVVTGSDSRILVASAGTYQTEQIPPPKPEQLAELVNSKVPVLDQEDGVILYQPILPTQVTLEDVEPESSVRPVGAVIVEMSKLQTNKLKSRLFWFTLLTTTIFLLVTLYIVHVASRYIIEPISQLSMAIRAIGSGNLETPVSVMSRIDELTTLSSGINQMRADLLHERDILQHRIDEATEQLRNLAFYDTLTLLPNRRLLNDRLAHALTTCKRSDRYGALMFIDLDNFKPLNDKFGHAVGDLLLIEVANRIRRCVREMDTVARFGGDEFVVVLSELSEKREESIAQAKLVAEKIRGVIEEQYNLVYQQPNQAEIYLAHQSSSSIGVVLFQKDDCQEDILKHADTAMYQAKEDGRNRICFFGLTE
jgi:diguanylate cyclase (GGDEF)-like protein